MIGICGAPFKCPPAPSECAPLLDDELRTRGIALLSGRRVVALGVRMRECEGC